MRIGVKNPILSCALVLCCHVGKGNLVVCSGAGNEQQSILGGKHRGKVLASARG